MGEGETRYNLLTGTAEVFDNDSYAVAEYKLAEQPLVVGKTYTLSAYVEEISRSGSDKPVLAVYDGACWWSPGALSGDVPGVQTITFTYKQPFDGHADPSRIFLFNTPPNGNGVVRRARFRDAMLVEGDTPAAWAPAEGEELSGGGALMSANLWDASAVNFKPDADGVYICGTSTGELNCSIAGASALLANQTVHFGASLRGAGKGYLSPFVEYRNAVGNLNWVGFPHWTPTDQWQRFEATCVVPSWMTITKIGFNTSGATGDIEVMNPAWSYGSPVCLASSAHTPYATQDHVAAEYATKAALKVTSDAVTAEVTERGKLAGRVGTLESTTGTHTSKLEQLAASIKSLVKGESTYTDPDGASATSGIYSLVTQTRDSVTALFGQYTKTADMQSQIATAKSQATSAANSATDGKLASYTKTADLASTTAVKDAKKAGTDAASAASAAQSTANAAKTNAATAQSTADAAKANAATAQSTANAAKGTADSLATLIRADSTGVTVGKSEDGETWSTGRTRMTADAFEVLDDGGKTLSSFSKDKVRLGVGSSTSEIDMADGHGKIFGYLDPQIADPGDGITELCISSDKFLTLHGANEALLYATPSSTVVEYQNSTHAVINVSSEIDDHTFSSDVRLEATAVDETDSDYNTKSTITMLASDGATLNGAQILTAPTVLFYNESQAFNTAISLSDSAGNYKRLKIFYKSDDEDYSSVDVYNPDGKTVALQIARPAYAYAPGAEPVMYVKSKIVKISGATIDTVVVSTYGGGENYLRMQKNLSGGYDASDKVGIIRVEGYKW